MWGKEQILGFYYKTPPKREQSLDWIHCYFVWMLPLCPCWLGVSSSALPDRAVHGHVQGGMWYLKGRKRPHRWRCGRVQSNRGVRVGGGRQADILSCCETRFLYISFNPAHTQTSYKPVFLVSERHAAVDVSQRVVWKTVLAGCNTFQVVSSESFCDWLPCCYPGSMSPPLQGQRGTVKVRALVWFQEWKQRPWHCSDINI